MVSPADASPVGAAWAAPHQPTEAATTSPVTAVLKANLFMILDRAGGYCMHARDNPRLSLPFMLIGRGHRRSSDPVRDRRGALGGLAASSAAVGSACWTREHPMRKPARASRNGRPLRRTRSRSLVARGAGR